jgi:hypothetical protein
MKDDCHIIPGRISTGSGTRNPVPSGVASIPAERTKVANLRLRLVAGSAAARVAAAFLAATFRNTANLRRCSSRQSETCPSSASMTFGSYRFVCRPLPHLRKSRRLATGTMPPSIQRRNSAGLAPSRTRAATGSSRDFSQSWMARAAVRRRSSAIRAPMAAASANTVHPFGVSPNARPTSLAAAGNVLPSTLTRVRTISAGLGSPESAAAVTSARRSMCMPSRMTLRNFSERRSKILKAAFLIKKARRANLLLQGWDSGARLSIGSSGDL